MRPRFLGALMALGLFLLGSAAAHALPALPHCGENNGVAAKGKPIIIGAITGQTGPDDFSSATKAAAAYFACVNANGGIHGRPVKYIVKDDQWNPQLASQLASLLVNDDKAVAMVGNSSFVECSVNRDFYGKAGIAVIAGVGVPHDCFYMKNYAATNAGPRISTTSAMQYALQHLHAKSFVCIGPDIPGVGQWGCGGVVELAAKYGYPAHVIIMNTASPDFTSIILQAMSYKPDAIIMQLPKGLTVPLLNAADNQGLVGKVDFLSAASAYAASVPEALGPDWNGHFYSGMEFNAVSSQGADNQNWLAIMNKYGRKSDPRDTFSQGGYLAAEIATKVLLSLPANDISRAAFLQALGKVDNFRSDILCGPWYFDASAIHHNPNHYTGMSVVENGKWKQIEACQPSEDPGLADLLAYEKKMGIHQ